MKKSLARPSTVIHHSREMLSMLVVALVLSACGGGGGGGGTVPTGAFTSFATLTPNTKVTIDGISSEVNWTGNPNTGSISPATLGLTLDSNGEITKLVISTPTSTATFSEAAGDMFAPVPSSPGLSVALNVTDLSAYVGANPLALGWNYQTFGIWETVSGTSSGTDGVFSVGAPTAGSAIPTTNSATFTGIAAGEYVDPSGVASLTSATLSVNADFVARTLGFNTTGTTTTQDFSTYIPNAGLNLSGTLSYAPGTNAFSGTLTSASGTLSGPSTGRFYGPNAEELGGVYFLKAGSGLETFGGAYGAKR